MPVRPEYIFRINKVYTRTAVDDAEIANDKAENKKWENGYKEFKKNIRRHLKLAQNGRCAFCRCRVSIGTSYSNLEHIVSKSEYSQFEFRPNNLVYCCWLCNKGKRVRNTLYAPDQNKENQQYPNNGNGFVVVNPYYDDYEAHIDFYDDVIIVPLNNSTKGINTIEFYTLTRPELAEERAREFKLKPQKVHAALLQTLLTNANDVQIVNQINQIIAQLPDWTI